MKRVRTFLPPNEYEETSLKLSGADLEKIASHGGIPFSAAKPTNLQQRFQGVIETYAVERVKHRKMPKGAEVRKRLEAVKHGIDGLLLPLGRLAANVPIDTFDLKGNRLEIADDQAWSGAEVWAVGSILHRPEQEDEVSPFRVLVQLLRMQRRAAEAIEQLSGTGGGPEGDPYFEIYLIPRLYVIWREAGGHGEPAQDKGGSMYAGAFLDLIDSVIKTLHSQNATAYPLKSRGTIYQAILKVTKQLSENPNS